jgi:hypothetical protein
MKVTSPSRHDVLLLWNFLPGRAVAAQVHRRLKSTVHFSPSLSTKELFLVASFSYSSISLKILWH